MKLNDIQIRETRPEDFNDIMLVEKLAFGYDKEALLTAQLLTDNTAEPIISLLAFYKDEAVGHILFTRAYFEEAEEQPLMHILAPLAVVPAFQKKGIGGLLINKGIELLRQKDSKLLFVLGHKDYYPKYGFIPKAIHTGYIPPYPMPEEYDDYWMVQPLTEEGFNAGKGKIRCCNMLNKPEHWRDEESDR